ncbi:MAG: ATP-dependent helicase HrpA [Polyangiaceae bacterium]|nr:ATP-dependent helicase HrpA [Polyangiaceae bacterium]
MERRLGAQLLATSPRIDWATLLRRTFDIDVLTCTRCQGLLRLMSVITDPATVRRILEHLGIPATVSPTPRARDPAVAS